MLNVTSNLVDYIEANPKLGLLQNPIARLDVYYDSIFSNPT